MNELFQAAINLDIDKIKEYINVIPLNRLKCKDIQDIYFISLGYFLLANGKFSPKYQPTADKIKYRARNILELLDSIMSTKHSDMIIPFMNWAKQVAFEDDNSDFEDSFFTKEDVLLRAGFRKIDLQLYIECERFNYSNVKDLLEKGANPDISLPFELKEENLPLPNDYTEIYETDSAIGHTVEYACSFFDIHDGMRDFENILNGKTMTNVNSQIINLMTCAANLLLYQLLAGYNKESEFTQIG